MLRDDDSVTLRQENPVLRDTICAGFGRCWRSGDVLPRLPTTTVD